MADRGVEQRTERAGQRATIRALLGTGTQEQIAAKVGCSLWLVADEAQVQAGTGRKARKAQKATDDQH